jgi:Ni,Fe-hydrogenase III large subunit/NADH:ubiquinone oxidoreductase subunit C
MIGTRINMAEGITEQVLDALYRVVDEHAPSARQDVDVRVVLLDDVWITLPVKCLRPAVEALVEQCGLRHLSTITGQHIGSEPDIEGLTELLYHFWQGHGLTLRFVLPARRSDRSARRSDRSARRSDRHEVSGVPSITDLIPGAAFYEREVAEMLGVFFEGHPDLRPLLLPDDWESGAPLRQNMAPATESLDPIDETQACPEPVPGGERMTIPIGPQHPVLKEPLSFLLTVDGERIVDSRLRIGYVHRGIERLCQERNYVQNVHLLERVCGICSHVHTTAYCQGVEALLGLEVPPRGLYLRTLLSELERVHSHLLWLGVLAENIGFTTIFMYAWRERETALDVMEELSGGRVTHAVNVIGGVRIDIDEKQYHSILSRLYALEHEVERFLNVIQNERSLRARTQGVGHLSAGDVRRWCTVGPMARASGVDVDLRRDAPYAAYDRVPIHVVLRDEGDVWARTLARVLETIESLRLCRQLLIGLPDGPTSVRAPRHVPAGEVVSRAEAPRGELVYYIRSDGSDRPARVKIRTPSLTTLITLDQQLRGVSTADVAVVLSGADLCIACADR